MTEIALALAMGFFSIMVLTMISMGSGSSQTAPGQPTVLKLTPSTDPDKATVGDAASSQSDDLILIFDGDRYFDVDLKPVDPGTLLMAMPDPDRRVVLALKPSLSVEKAIAAQRLIAVPNLVISSLDERWVKALAARTERRDAR